ncbi:MAG: hypothetical protein GWP06_07130 [Actinobacteria bacterium]|nr:hypothetical protein [Actinomycetota bacterium]
MKLGISHSYKEETLDAKAEWFQSLSLEKRMELFSSYIDLILENNPRILEKKMLNQLQDVFKSFQNHDVKYLVIGGIAAVLYGVPRATFDLNIIIEATERNAQRLLDAMLDAGLGTADLTNVQDVLAHEISIFQDRVRIDVQTKTPGLNFADAWEKRQVMKYRGQELFIVSRQYLISSKLAAGRDIDLEDVRMLKLGSK